MSTDKPVGGVDSPHPTFGLARLATYFAWPATSYGVHAAALWNDVELIRALPPRPSGLSDVTEVGDRLTATVIRCIEGHETIAVAMSGGLASAALADTAARLCARTGRRLVAVTVDVADDLGRRARSTAAGLLRLSGVDATHITIPARPSQWPQPAWDPTGPQLVPWPRYRAGLALAAQQAGATVLLDGHGARRLLPATGYLIGELVRHRDWPTLSAYRRDAITPPVLELLAACGAPMRAVGARLYWARMWSDAALERDDVLAEPYRQVASNWQSSFVAESLRAAVARRAGWAEARLMYRCFPCDPRPPADEIAESSPFLESDFARYAYHLPLHDRFSAGQPTEYLRRNAVLARLLPASRSLPPAACPTTHHRARARYWLAVDGRVQNLVDLGIIRPDWRRHCHTPTALAAVLSCESWVDRAIASGAVAA